MWKLVMLTLAACGAKRVEHVELEVSVSGTTSLVGAKLELDGREVGVLGPGTRDTTGRAKVTLPPVERTLDTFALLVQTPCGNKRIPLVHSGAGRQEITDVELAPVNAGGVYVALQVPEGALSMYGVFYDNRGGKERTLTIGTLTLPVRANSRGVLPVWEPMCAKPVAIRVDGRALDVAQDAFADQCGPAVPAHVFVGLAATCYVVHAVPYELDLPPLPGNVAPASETKLQGHDAYVVPAVRYVMEKAPERIQTDEVRNQCLRDIVECGS